MSRSVLTEDQVGDTQKFMKEQQEVEVQIYEGKTHRY